MHAVGRSNCFESTVCFSTSFSEPLPAKSTSACAITPSPISTDASMCVRVPNMSFMAPLAAAESVTFSHFELTWLTVESVVDIVGKSRKNPAPADASPAKNEIPRSKAGLKPAETVSSTFAVLAWNGKAVTAVLSLSSRNQLELSGEGKCKMLTSLGRRNRFYFPGQVRG